MQRSLFAALFLAQCALAQATFPLTRTASEPATGGLVHSVDVQATDELAQQWSASFDGVLLPDGSVVDLDLQRIDHARLSFAFHVDGAPAGDLLDGLALSVWKGSVRGLAGSDVRLAFSHLGAHGWIHTGSQLVHLITRPAPGDDWDHADVLMTTEASLNALGTAHDGACSMLRPTRRAATPTFPSGGGPAYLGAGTCNLRECKVAIESDFQYFQRFNSVPAQASYTATLWAFISDRYETQASTILTFPYVGFYTSASDPWSSPDTGAGAGAMLGEFQAAWVGNIPGGARVGHFMSGAGLGGGVAWLGVLCDNTYNFAVSGNLDAGTPFPVQQSPANWDFMVCAHELGHNFSAPHTHDYCPPVDECSPSGYFGGCQTQQVCTNQGTLMSYCHLCGGGLANVMPSFHPVSAQDMTNAALACLPAYEGISANVPSVLAPFQANALSATISGVPLGAVRAYWRASPGMPWQLATLSTQGGGVWTGSLPPFACSDTPQWYYEFDEQSCGTIRFPSTAPASPLAAPVGAQSTSFSDNFETDLGWTPSVLGAVGGPWQRGVPVQDPYWGYAPLVDGDGSGSCWLTGNTMGNSDVDLGAVQLLSPPLDLSGSDLALEYLYYLRLSIANGVDMFKLEISPANGAGPWTEIARHTTSSNNWRSHVISGASIAALGVPLGANMRVRVTVNDGGGASIVEGGFDGFLVRKIVCQGPLGLSYCTAFQNSSGAPAQMAATGSTSLSANNLVLSAAPVPSSTFGLFLYGPQTAFINFGGAIKCVGGPTRRLPLTGSGGTTSLSHSVNLLTGPAAGVLVPGTTWYFQAWFRDTGFGNASTALSDGLRLTFGP
jgi:hypothetical protein